MKPRSDPPLVDDEAKARRERLAASLKKYLTQVAIYFVLGLVVTWLLERSSPESLRYFSSQLRHAVQHWSPLALAGDYYDTLVSGGLFVLPIPQPLHLPLLPLNVMVAYPVVVVKAALQGVPSFVVTLLTLAAGFFGIRVWFRFRPPAFDREGNEFAALLLLTPLAGSLAALVMLGVMTAAASLLEGAAAIASQVLVFFSVMPPLVHGLGEAALKPITNKAEEHVVHVGTEAITKD